jgi:hypothetical protein
MEKNLKGEIKKLNNRVKFLESKIVKVKTKYINVISNDNLFEDDKTRKYFK